MALTQSHPTPHCPPSLGDHAIASDLIMVDGNNRDTLLPFNIASSTSMPCSSLSISTEGEQNLSAVSSAPAAQQQSVKPKTNFGCKLVKEIRCVCKLNNGSPCWVYFQEEQLRKERLHHLQMKKETLDLVILTTVSANINQDTKACHRPHRPRQRAHITYLHEGHQVCRETFMFIHGVCKSRLTALISHFKTKGVTGRIHKNVNSTPKHALTTEDTSNVLDFVKDYASKHALKSTVDKTVGIRTGEGNLIVIKDQSKSLVHKKYNIWCSKQGRKAVGLRSFQVLWNKHLPHIVVPRGSSKCNSSKNACYDGIQDCFDNDEDDVERNKADSCLEKRFSNPISNSLSKEISHRLSQNHTFPSLPIDNSIHISSLHLDRQQLCSESEQLMQTQKPSSDNNNVISLHATQVNHETLTTGTTDDLKRLATSNIQINSDPSTSLSNHQLHVSPKTNIVEPCKKSSQLFPALGTNSLLVLELSRHLHSETLHHTIDHVNQTSHSQLEVTDVASEQVLDPIALPLELSDMIVSKDVILLDYQAGENPDWHPWTTLSSL